MLTVAELAGAPHALLRYALVLDPAAARAVETQLVETVEVCDEQWNLPDEADQAQDTLAIVPNTGELLTDPDAALRRLAERGVIAVAIATLSDSPLSLPDSVVRAAHTYGLRGLILLISALPRDPHTLQSDLLRRLLLALRESRQRQDMLNRLAAKLDRQGEGPGPYLRRLGAECRAEVDVVEPDHPLWDTLAGEIGTVLTQVRSGQLNSAITELDAGSHVFLHAVGATEPYPVLAAIRPAPWPRPLRELVTAATGTIARLQDPLDRRAAEKRLLHAETAVRVAVLQLLMCGDTVMAGRAVEPLVPGMLTGERCRVAVVECDPKEDRSTVARECERTVGGRGLVVLCPAEDRHVIVVMAADEAQNLKETLAPIAQPWRAVGISMPEPWTGTASAYDAAFRALATARQEITRISVHDGGAPLAAHLPPAAGDWAHALLRPLRQLPPEHSDMLVHTARLALAYGALSAGRLVGCDRTTARKRLALVMERVGLNHSDLPDRAVADLALQLAQIQSPGATHGGGPPGLHAVLQSADEAKREAKRFLDPLGADTRGQLVVWIRANAITKAAADELDISRNTLSQYLEKAGAQLASPLTPPGGGAHSLLFALILTEELPVDTVPDPVTSVLL